MKVVKNARTAFVFGVIFTGSMNVTQAANVNVNLNDNVFNSGTFIQVQGTDNTAYNLDEMKAENVKQDGQIYNLQGDRERMQNEIDASKVISALTPIIFPLFRVLFLVSIMKLN
ncbi:hypothetical protein UXO30_09385 [Enterobacter bugandensis]|uniref:hypothetical protein n=1 Tax=Enterobacter bugandensis TaxID=881260 RepID=UPI002FCFBE56